MTRRGTAPRRSASRGLGVLALGLLLLSLMGACDAGEGSPAGGGLTVFAAASLTDVMRELEEGWRASHPDVPLTLTFDATNVLATQISEGASADVFVAADRQRPDELARAGLTAAPPVPFARNRLTLAVPLESSAVETAADLARPGVRIVAAGRSVPITRYAEAAIDQLAAAMPDGATFRERVAANVVSREDNVRAALAKVELGEGDAAIVYATDVRTSGRVREVPFPAVVDVTAEYAAVRISERPAAGLFLDWLRGPEARSILAAHGFRPAPQPS